MPVDERPRPEVATSPVDWRAAGIEHQTRKALATLDPPEEEILRLRFGIGDVRHLSPAQIGLRFGWPETWVRQIETNALRKLRHPSHRRRHDDLGNG